MLNRLSSRVIYSNKYFQAERKKEFFFILLEEKMMSPNITGNYFFCVQMNSNLNQHLNGLQSWIANCSWNEHCFADSFLWKQLSFSPTNTVHTWLSGFFFFNFGVIFLKRRQYLNKWITPGRPVMVLTHVWLFSVQKCRPGAFVPVEVVFGALDCTLCSEATVLLLDKRP